MKKKIPFKYYRALLEMAKLERGKDFENQTKTQQLIVLNKQDEAIRIGINVLENEKLVYIGFEGSREFKDWLDNFKIWMLPFYNYGGKVHAGFRKQFAIADKFLCTRIMSYQRLGYEIIFYGHSLGSGISQLFTNKYEEDSFILAAPRAGNGRFVKGMERGAKVISIKHGDDMVANMPKSWWGYRHAKQNVTMIGEKKGWFRSWKKHTIDTGYLPILINNHNIFEIEQ